MRINTGLILIVVDELRLYSRGWSSNKDDVNRGAKKKKKKIQIMSKIIGSGVWCGNYSYQVTPSSKKNIDKDKKIEVGEIFYVCQIIYWSIY